MKQITLESKMSPLAPQFRNNNVQGTKKIKNSFCQQSFLFVFTLISFYLYLFVKLLSSKTQWVLGVESLN